MQTKPKSNSIITHEMVGTRSIDFKFRGVTIGQLRLDSMSPQNMERAMVHGMLQRVGDGGAVERTNPDGTIRTPSEMDSIKQARMIRLIEHYNSGSADWTIARAEGVQRDDTTLAKAAIMRVKGWDDTTFVRLTTAFAEKQYGGDTKAAVKFLATGEAVLAMIATIKAERLGPAAVDAAAMLDELEECRNTSREAGVCARLVIGALMR